MTTRRDYALGTYLEHSNPYGLYVSGRAICSDGRVRKLKRISETADTFFSVPAAVTVQGRTVSGFITVETISGYSTESEGDPAVVKFQANQYGKNSGVLPRGAYKASYIETREGAEKYLTRDGNLGVPVSRYGSDSRSCASIAYAAAVIVSGETGEPLTAETLDYVMGLVVNNHDDPETLIRDYGREYGFSPNAFLD